VATSQTGPSPCSLRKSKTVSIVIIHLLNYNIFFPPLHFLGSITFLVILPNLLTCQWQNCKAKHFLCGHPALVPMTGPHGYKCNTFFCASSPLHHPHPRTLSDLCHLYIEFFHAPDAFINSLQILYFGVMGSTTIKNFFNNKLNRLRCSIH